jgi:serine/threonine protein kinase
MQVAIEAIDDPSQPWWTVQPEDAFAGMGKKLGEGGCGSVYRCNLWQVPVALKNWGSGRMQKAPPDYYRELAAGLKVRSLHHPNIVSILGRLHGHPGYAPYIIFELAKHGSLDSLLYSGTFFESLSLRQCLIILNGIACGMAALHSVDLIHRDLKSMNVLIGKNCRPMITDFGVAREVSDVMTTQTGTMLWMAPEVVETKEYSTAADVFSYGLVVYESFAGSIPKRDALMQMTGAVPPLPASLPPDAHTFYSGCCSVNPENRPNFVVISKAITSLLSTLPSDQLKTTRKRVEGFMRPS